jgi:putative membrane protein
MAKPNRGASGMVEEITLKPKFIVLYILVAIVAIIMLGLLAYLYYAGEILPEFFTVFFFGIVILALIAFLAIFLKYLSTTYKITEKEIISIEGLITQTKRSVPFSKIDNVTIHRGLLDLILQTGSIYIDTPGGPGIPIIMYWIDAEKLSSLDELIRKLMEQEMSKKEAKEAEERAVEKPAKEKPAKRKPRSSK